MARSRIAIIALKISDFHSGIANQAITWLGVGAHIGKKASVFDTIIWFHEALTKDKTIYNLIRDEFFSNSEINMTYILSESNLKNTLIWTNTSVTVIGTVIFIIDLKFKTIKVSEVQEENVFTYLGSINWGTANEYQTSLITLARIVRKASEHNSSWHRLLRQVSK